MNSDKKEKDLLAVLATARLSPEQISRLSPEQISRLSAVNIPVVENLYSKILADIKAEKRKLDQSTFGPEKLLRENELCGSPMCIAGHTVNIAGEDGWKLRERVGFAVAAMLIHRASRKDVSEPRYDNYPSAWALAYIEARAAEEPQA